MKKAIVLILTILVFHGIAPAQSIKEMFNQGVQQYKNGCHQDAVETFSTVIAADPETIGAYRFRGASHMALERYDDAIKDFEMAIGLSPDTFGVHSDLGAAWYQKKEYEKAIGYYDTELEKGRKNHLFYFNRALCLEQMGKMDQALNDLETCLGLEPDFYWGLCYKGDLLTKKKFKKEAIEAYEAAIQINPKKAYAQDHLKAIQIEVSRALSKTPDRKKKISRPKTEKNGRYSIQAGAFKSRTNARGLKSRLDKEGYSPEILTLTDRKNEPWYLVRVGRYPDHQSAAGAAEKFRQKMDIPCVVRPAGSW